MELKASGMAGSRGSKVLFTICLFPSLISPGLASFPGKVSPSGSKDVHQQPYLSNPSRKKRQFVEKPKNNSGLILIGRLSGPELLSRKRSGVDPTQPHGFSVQKGSF